MNNVEKKYLVPNAITAANMFLGFVSITMSIKGRFDFAALLILAAMIFDALDGYAARKLNAFSEFGKEFDSFCDAISFGLAPGILIYSILTSKVIPSVHNFPHELIIPVSFIYVLGGIVRLVKFNVVTTASSSKDDFSGMPIPNAANLVVSYILFVKVIGYHIDPMFLTIIAIGSGFLMISTIPFQIPQKTFAFIPDKLVLPLALLILYFAKYALFPLGLYYVLANLYKFVNTKEKNKDSLEKEL
ncbi:MAG: CDP-diacylglycerol--serine O-phosphatidyltransferase [Psychrilyobacter sp.]|nr:CDP-diacylglycerol--serine O-phosphatidyltransferase [Psychrilyobacter sp.]